MKGRFRSGNQYKSPKMANHGYVLEMVTVKIPDT